MLTDSRLGLALITAMRETRDATENCMTACVQQWPDHIL